MRTLTIIIAALASLAAAAPAPEDAQPKPEAPKVSFRAVDVWVDPAAAKLAAYQVEIQYDAKTVKVVGVEGGEPQGFRDAPSYDEAGKAGGRIVLAAFVSDDAQATGGRQRVARLHVQVEGGAAPECTAKPVAAAQPGGKRIEAKAEAAAAQALEEKKGN